MIHYLDAVGAPLLPDYPPIYGAVNTASFVPSQGGKDQTMVNLTMDAVAVWAIARWNVYICPLRCKCETTVVYTSVLIKMTSFSCVCSKQGVYCGRSST